MKTTAHKFLAYLAVMSLLVLINLKCGRYFVRYEYGPGTEERILKGFEDAVTQPADCFILGNSRIYRGIDPDFLSAPAYNFAHEDGAYNQYYYKLLFLEKYQKPVRRLILGMDYFQFSALPESRNHIFKPLFDPAYMADFAPPEPLRFDRKLLWKKDFFAPQNEAFNRYMSIHFSQTGVSFLSWAFKTVFRLPVTARKYQKDNGFYVVNGQQAYANDIYIRDGRRLPVQEHYFESILRYAADHQIKVALVMPPLREGELKNYEPGVISEHEAYINRHLVPGQVFYLNYSTSSAFTTPDYADITHLTPEGAEKFSQLLDRDLKAAHFY